MFAIYELHVKTKVRLARTFLFADIAKGGRHLHFVVPMAIGSAIFVVFLQTKHFVPNFHVPWLGDVFATLYSFSFLLVYVLILNPGYRWRDDFFLEISSNDWTLSAKGRHSDLLEFESVLDCIRV